MKNLLTTDLLNKVNEREYNENAVDELLERSPFDFIFERIEELEKGLADGKEEIQKLRNTMRGHTHLPNGKSVKEI